MSTWQAVLLALGTPLAGVWFCDLQARLERWDAERHALD
jgi:hypothetical protein